jgi:Skp family chaperone for outer membrane proteins
MEMAPNVQSTTLREAIRDMLELMRNVEEKGRLETEEKERLKTLNEHLAEEKGLLITRLTQVLEEKRLLAMESAHEKGRLEKQIVQLQEDIEKALQPLQTQVQQLQAEVQDIQQERRGDLDAALDRVRNRSWHLGDFSLLCDLVTPQPEGRRRRARKRSLTLYEQESVATPPLGTDQRKKKRTRSASAAEDAT